MQRPDAPAAARFRKKPIVIEATRWDGDNWPDFLQFIVARGGRAHTEFDGTVLVIDTLEGAMRAEIGDWIIRGVAGEFYPCKPDIFEQTYEAAVEAPPLPAPRRRAATASSGPAAS